MRIPQELREREQWVIAGPDKRPWSTTGFPASVVDPSTWTDFYSASMVAAQWGAGVGYVLHESDPFSCIDLDVKEDTDPDMLEIFQAAIEGFDSYTEYSRSGKGFHIWVRGKVGLGCRGGGIEIYSQERFIICTGNVVRDVPIAERQELLDNSVANIRAGQNNTAAEVLVEVDATLTDEQIWERASTAVNADKFLALWNCTCASGTPDKKVEGSYTALGYPSQSEADLALLSMLTFYSKSNEQCRRIFRRSGLGQRGKAQKNDYYLNNTLKLIRGRIEAAEHQEAAIRVSGEKLLETVKKELPEVAPGGLPWPPGFMGELAKWLHAQAPRPVQEVSIVSALGAIAGVAGRAFNINRSGLNLYIVLVARSAIGKEAIHSGLSKLAFDISQGCSTFSNFLDFADYASGPALIKSLGERNSFLNIAGEWGRKMRKMADDLHEGPMSSLRTAMTNLYQKSSAGTMVGGIGYSNKEKDVKSVDGVAYSMLGETTPDTFYESLTNTMMQDGFMSRFIVVEYTGLRPELNTSGGYPLSMQFKDYLSKMSDACAGDRGGSAYSVMGNEEAVAMLDAFNKECDTQINATEDESWRQMWNRAHLKALKISGLLAVADDYEKPVVTAEHARWALDVVKRDIHIMSKKMKDGDVGDGDMVRELKMMSVMREYLRGPVPKSYNILEPMRAQGIVPRKYLQVRVQKVNSFVKFRNGQTAALDQCLKSMSDSGYIVEIQKDKLPQEWGYHGRCYRIIDLSKEN